MNRPKMLY
uniref:Uncharacterized protein n=1 Tax=Anguilla anguilla TaxID=7936 RepID=A0A0E9TPC1_ANGAN